MNGTTLLKAMNGVDERFLADAMQPAPRITSRRRRIIAAVSIAAAAVLMTTAVDAGYQLTHPESVAHWLTGGSAKMLADKELVLNEVYENEHYRVTAETLLSDGYMADLILTVEPLDPAEELTFSGISESRPVLCYTDGGEVEGSGCSSGAGFSDATEERVTTQVYFMLEPLNPELPVADLTRDMEVRFEPHHENGENPLESIVIPVDLTPNVTLLTCKSEDGGIVCLSPFEMHSETEQLDVPAPAGNSNIRLLRKNGIPLLVDHDSTLLHGLEPSGGWTYRGSDAAEKHMTSCIEFRELINIDDFCGVKIGDTVYTAE